MNSLKNAQVEFQLKVSKNCTELLSKQIETLQETVWTLRNTFGEK